MELGRGKKSTESLWQEPYLFLVEAYLANLTRSQRGGMEPRVLPSVLENAASLAKPTKLLKRRRGST